MLNIWYRFLTSLKSHIFPIYFCKLALHLCQTEKNLPVAFVWTTYHRLWEEKPPYSLLDSHPRRKQLFLAHCCWRYFPSKQDWGKPLLFSHKMESQDWNHSTHTSKLCPRRVVCALCLPSLEVLQYYTLPSCALTSEEYHILMTSSPSSF